jgi:hypothetical protein
MELVNKYSGVRGVEFYYAGAVRVVGREVWGRKEAF